MKLRRRTTLILIALMVLAVALNAIWSMNSQLNRAEDEMLEKSRILTEELDAVWEFMDINQDRIDTDADGSYNFKGLYCAIAGKSIAKILERESDYIVRYTSPTPRKSAFGVDEYEANAVSAFENGDSEYYSMSEYNGMQVFRYVKPIYIEESCLDCHGSPAGEIDVTGYVKEGMEVGDLVGVTSIIMPIDAYMTGIQNSIIEQSIYFAVVIGVIILVIGLVITRTFTQPLTQIGKAAEQIEAGDFNINLQEVGTSEIRDLARQIGSMAEQLKTLYENLEGEVALRTEQLASANELLEEQQRKLAEANEELKEENRYKSDILAVMSHELRTPLTAIIAYTDMWLASTAHRGGSEESAVREIKENGQILLSMVNNSLAMARIEAGKDRLSPESFDMVDLVDIVARSISFVAEQRGITLKTIVHPDVPIITADWEKIRRIVENLASNAVKFTRRGGSMTIEVSHDPKSSEVVIQVSDTGKGISKDDLPFIFERFTQSDKSSQRRYKGSGLGLAVVKEMVAMHHGAIDVKSVVHEGSVFTVRIPDNCREHNPATTELAEQEGIDHDEDSAR